MNLAHHHFGYGATVQKEPSHPHCATRKYLCHPRGNPGQPGKPYAASLMYSAAVLEGAQWGCTASPANLLQIQQPHFKKQ